MITEEDLVYSNDSSCSPDIPPDSCSINRDIVTPCNYVQTQSTATEDVIMDEDSKNSIPKKTTIFRCSVCEYYSLIQEDTQRHVAKHNALYYKRHPEDANVACSDSNTNLQCPECSFIASNKAGYTAHQKFHFGTGPKKPYKCSYCNYRGRNKSHVQSHEYCKHTGEKPFECMYCTFRTSHRAALTVHLRRHTGNRPYKCDYCAWTGTETSQLIIHQRKHTGQKPYFCEHCDYRAASRSAVMLHENIHDDIKSKFCPLCSFATHTASKLRSHMKKHKLRFCQLCPFSSTNGKDFKQHKKSHYKLDCKFCSKVFPGPSKLREHEATHMGNRKFKCDKCSYNTARKLLLDKHVEQVHFKKEPDNPDEAEKLLKCPSCKFAANRANSMALHRKTHKIDTVLMDAVDDAVVSEDEFASTFNNDSKIPHNQADQIVNSVES